MRKFKNKPRVTRETDITIEINLDGSGKCKLDSPKGFFNHMLETFSKHSGIDLNLRARGDIEVDFHHIIEDIGIVLGENFNKALGDKKGINRFGWAIVPMDESLTMCSIDISGRPSFKYNVKFKNSKVGEFDTELIKEFFKAFSDNAKIALHINTYYGTNSHHIIESVFKSFSQAVKIAVAKNKNIKGVPSVKDVI